MPIKILTGIMLKVMDHSLSNALSYFHDPYPYGYKNYNPCPSKQGKLTKLCIPLRTGLLQTKVHS